MTERKRDRRADDTAADDSARAARIEAVSSTVKALLSLGDIGRLALIGVLLNLDLRDIQALCSSSERFAAVVCGQFPGYDKSLGVSVDEYAEQLGYKDSVFYDRVWRDLLARDFGLSDDPDLCRAPTLDVRKVVVEKFNTMVPRGRLSQLGTLRQLRALYIKLYQQQPRPNESSSRYLRFRSFKKLYYTPGDAVGFIRVVEQFLPFCVLDVIKFKYGSPQDLLDVTPELRVFREEEYSVKLETCDAASAPTGLTLLATQGRGGVGLSRDNQQGLVWRPSIVVHFFGDNVEAGHSVKLHGPIPLSAFVTIGRDTTRAQVDEARYRLTPLLWQSNVRDEFYVETAIVALTLSRRTTPLAAIQLRRLQNGGRSSELVGTFREQEFLKPLAMSELGSIYYHEAKNSIDFPGASIVVHCSRSIPESDFEQRPLASFGLTRNYAPTGPDCWMVGHRLGGGLTYVIVLSESSVSGRVYLTDSVAVLVLRVDAQGIPLPSKVYEIEFDGSGKTVGAVWSARRFCSQSVVQLGIGGGRHILLDTNTGELNESRPLGVHDDFERLHFEALGCANMTMDRGDISSTLRVTSADVFIEQ